MTKRLTILTLFVASGCLALLVWQLQPDATSSSLTTGSQTAQTMQPSSTTTATRTPLQAESITPTTATGTDSNTAPATTTTASSSDKIRFIAVQNSCDHSYRGTCAVARVAPNPRATTTAELRNDMVLRTDEQIVNEFGTWFRLAFDDQWLRYPERVTSDWYVSAADVAVLYEPGTKTTWEDGASSTQKRIVIDVGEQVLRAYEGEQLAIETTVSTGLDLSPTTIGSFTVFKKTPSRYMQGPIADTPASDRYDLPGVPWNLYFTEAGEVIHGTYWHDSFGQQYSHGCVNVPPEIAAELYHWTPLRTTVVVQR